METAAKNDRLNVILFGYYPEPACKSCQTGCGGKIHKHDNEEVRKAVISGFEDSMALKMVNVFSEDLKQYPDVETYIKQNGLRLPVLVIEGKIRLAGIDASIDSIRREIESDIRGSA